MLNVADISTYLLEQFYDEKQRVNEEILLENGIPTPLYKAYANMNEKERDLDNFMKGKAEKPSYMNKGTARKFDDIKYNRIFNGNRNYLSGNYGSILTLSGDYGKVKYKEKTIKEALSDLNIQLTLNAQPWELDLNNMPENPKDLKATISNREDTKNKIIDYRFVYDNATYIQFAYIEEKAKIYPIVRGDMFSFRTKMVRFNYTGGMFNTKLDQYSINMRVDYIQNEASAIAWSIIFSDHIFKTNESEVLEPEGDRLEVIKNRKMGYLNPDEVAMNPDNFDVTKKSKVNTSVSQYYDYRGTKEQNKNRTRYNPFTTITTNVDPEKISFKQDTGNHLMAFNHEVTVLRETYLNAKRELLCYQHKLKNLIQSKDAYIEDNLEDLYDSRLKQYNNFVKIALEEYKEAKNNFKDGVKHTRKYISDINYKFKQKILTYYRNVENMYAQIRDVSLKLDSLQNYDFKEIQKEFGVDTKYLQQKLIDVHDLIKKYKEDKERLQERIEETRAKIEDLQRQIQKEQQDLEAAQEEDSLVDKSIKELSRKEIKLQSAVNSDTQAVKEFYKKRIELNNKGKELEKEITKLKYEFANKAKEDNVIDYTKKSTAKPEDKEKILNVLSGISALASGLSEIKSVEANPDGLILDDEDELQPEDISD